MEPITVIKLNNYSFPMLSFNKHTSVDGDRVSSYANITFGAGVTEDDFEPLLLTEIETLQIENDKGVIYSLSNKHAKINNIQETYDGEKISVYANIYF